MAQVNLKSLSEDIAELKQMIAALARRVAEIEGNGAVKAAPAAPAEAAAPVETGVSEEVLIAISAALAAYLGKRPKIRQVRLLGSAAWAQQGRVSIQASHHLEVSR